MPDRPPGFCQRTPVNVGPGVIGHLPQEVRRLGIREPVVLMDEALVDGPVGRRIASLLPEATVISPEPGEPTYKTVSLTVDKVKQASGDGLVAVGGGSTIDTAKIARGLLSAHVATPTDLPSSFPQPLLPLIAVPTTAGTGSEVGAGAVVTDPDTGEKVLVSKSQLAPDLALADGDLTLTLPRHLTAFTGCDALAHALLAYVGSGKYAVSGVLALQAVKTIVEDLPDAVRNGSDRTVRARMMFGSVTSAISMFTSPMTYAGEHTFAEALGPPLQLHHGHVVAVFLPGVAQFNRRPLTGPLGEVARHLGLVGSDVSNDEASTVLIERLRTFLKDLGIAPLGDDVKDRAEDLVPLVKRHPGFALNPCPLDDAAVAAIIRGACTGSYDVAYV